MRLRSINVYRLEFIRSECTQTSLKYGVRVRFAPSPTGKMHLGGLRTALYNFLFSRSHKGKFILRIEDTDQKRAVAGVSQQVSFVFDSHFIEKTLDYYGLKRDEGPCEGGPFGPYVQSSRLKLYQEAAERLVDSGHAYRCFCTKERLEMLRREALKRRETPGYDNHCRSLSNEEIKARMHDNLPFVIRFKLKSEPITFHTLLKLELISNLRAFEWNQPKWIHLPLITRDGSKKLSKRDHIQTKSYPGLGSVKIPVRGGKFCSKSSGVPLSLILPSLSPATIRLISNYLGLSTVIYFYDQLLQDSFVEFYHEHEGYLPLAVINFLLRNGSGIRNFNVNHLYTIDELIENFDVNTIGRRNFMMDRQSLDQYGRLAFESADFDGLIEDELIKYVKKHFGCDEGLNELINDTKYLKKVIAFLRSNEETFSHISQLSSNQFKFLFSYPSDSKKIIDEFDRNLAIAIINSVRNCDDRNLDALKRLAKENDMKYPKLLHLVRLALINNPHGPPILELFDFFGEQQCNERFDRMLGMLNNTAK
ncbi:unnamed protein product [Anisakis simplex]|uniref:Probable glutamate--tRNA ligase, mitochondrial (inferred by orthology to a human protein) n=1 Tax=Anisakis simplex TaxID=6269 RepID=A0A0M3K7F4_ANISI|nr:unnamed protein product [Anisakis simplex]